jgi:hypothetical protein
VPPMADRLAHLMQPLEKRKSLNHKRGTGDTTTTSGAPGEGATFFLHLDDATG